MKLFGEIESKEDSGSLSCRMWLKISGVVDLRSNVERCWRSRNIVVIVLIVVVRWMKKERTISLTKWSSS